MAATAQDHQKAQVVQDARWALGARAVPDVQKRNCCLYAQAKPLTAADPPPNGRHGNNGQSVFHQSNRMPVPRPGAVLRQPQKKTCSLWTALLL